MSIPNPLKLKLEGKRQVAIDEEPLTQVGTDLDHLNLYPEITPHARADAPETLTDSNCIFVDHSGGNDANPGTSASPKKTFGSAITKADTSDNYKYFCCINTSYTYVEDIFFSHKYTKLYSWPVWYSIYQDSVTCYIRRIKRTAPALTNANCIFTDFKNGNDSTGTGTQTQPYKTLQKACDIAYAAGAVDKYIGILVDSSYTENDYTSEESIELICPSSNYRKIYVVWRDAADEFKAGVTAQLKYKFDERATSSNSYTWYGYYFESGKFPQGGLDTLYVAGYDGVNSHIYYSTDGINFSVVTTDPFPARPFFFTSLNIGGTETLFVGTDAGVYKSTNGLTWTLTNLTTAYRLRVITWNNNVLASGTAVNGLYRTPNDAGVWSSVDSIGGWTVTPTPVGNYLFYYDATNVKIKKCDTSWTTSDVVTISEVDVIDDFCELNEKLYCIARNTGTGIMYFIEVEQDGNYTIIYSKSYTSYYPRNIITVDERIYIAQLADSTSLHAYDGKVFYDIGDFTTANIYYLSFGFRNRLYCSVNGADTIKYGILDNLIISADVSSGLDSRLEGVILDGNEKKASNLIRSETSSGWTICTYCKSKQAYRLVMKAGEGNGYNLRYTLSIANNFQNGFYGHQIALMGLFKNISNILSISTDTIDPVNNTIDSSTLDNINQLAIGLISLRDTLCMRSAKITDNVTGYVISVFSGNIIQLPCDMAYVGNINDSEYGTAIFRNRDSINQDFSDYRLQAKWGQASNGEYYKFDSLGIDFAYKLSLSGYYDSGCYYFERSVYSDTYKYQWAIDWTPDETNYMQSFENLSSLIAVNGVKKFSHEGEPNQLSISWVPDTPTENLELKTLYTMLRLNEPMRLTLNHWYDYTDTELTTHATNGDLGIFSGPSEIGGGNVYATFDPDEMTLVQTENTWFDDEFKGWLAYISYDDSGTRKSFWLKITKNTEDTLYLQDVDGLYEIPSAAIDNDSDDMVFIIGAMYVKVDAKQLKSQLALWYSKAQSSRGALQITFEEA